MSTKPENRSPATCAAVPGAITGAAIITGARVAGLALSFVAIAIVARRLTPDDYGLVAMVLSVTAFLLVFSDMGLSLVTVQRRDISREQLSTLFWLNLAIGILLALITAAFSPVLVWFYGDARLLPVGLALSIVFPVMALSVQHQALLKRDMQFTRIAAVRMSGTVAGAVASILAAVAGWGHWALVVQSISVVSVQTLASFIARPWLPGPPRRCGDLHNMLSFGGNLTAHGMVGYLANNVDKVLLGRFCGAHELGLYANSYNLMMRPIALAGYGVGEAAIPALSRSGGSPELQRSTFRRMYGLTALLGIPACIGGALWAEDIVRTMLGAQWLSATTVLRVLLIAALARMLHASTGWVFVATGRPHRMLRWQLMWTPVVLAAFLIGLPHGAIGVATGYAAANWLAIGFGFAYCFSGTRFSLSDALRPAVSPLMCTLVACTLANLGGGLFFPDLTAGPARLFVRLSLALVCYTAITPWCVPLANEAVRNVLHRLERARDPQTARQAGGTVT